MSEAEPAKPPPEPKLFKILCCPVNTKLSGALIDTLATPYENNDEDRNTIIGSITEDNSNTKVEVPPQVRKIISVDVRLRDR